jgi:hypothetical protein
MAHRLPPDYSKPLTEDEDSIMDDLIDAFEHSDIQEMIRICKLCPRVFDEPFETDRARRKIGPAIVLAVAVQNVDMVKALAGLLVEWGMNPTLVYDIDTASYSSTLLIKAAEYGSFYIVRNLMYLLGTDVNAKDSEGYTALTMLFKNQIRPMNPFHRLRCITLEILLRKGADVSITDPFTGETPLFAACYQATDRPLRVLLQNAANPFALDLFGRTPRENALWYGGGDNNVCVRILQEVENRIITYWRVRNETQKLALMMGFHKRLGEAAQIRCLDHGMFRRDIVDEWFPCTYTRLALSNMSNEEVRVASCDLTWSKVVSL